MMIKYYTFNRPIHIIGKCIDYRNKIFRKNQFVFVFFFFLSYRVRVPTDLSSSSAFLNYSFTTDGVTKVDKKRIPMPKRQILISFYPISISRLSRVAIVFPHAVGKPIKTPLHFVEEETIFVTTDFLLYFFFFISILYYYRQSNLICAEIK